MRVPFHIYFQPPLLLRILLCDIIDSINWDLINVRVYMIILRFKARGTHAQHIKATRVLPECSSNADLRDRKCIFGIGIGVQF